SSRTIAPCILIASASRSLSFSAMVLGVFCSFIDPSPFCEAAVTCRTDALKSGDHEGRARMLIRWARRIDTLVAHLAKLGHPSLVGPLAQFVAHLVSHRTPVAEGVAAIGLVGTHNESCGQVGDGAKNHVLVHAFEQLLFETGDGVLWE